MIKSCTHFKWPSANIDTPTSLGQDNGGSDEVVGRELFVILNRFAFIYFTEDITAVQQWYDSPESDTAEEMIRAALRG